MVLDHVVYHCLFGEIDLFALEAGLETPSNLLFLGRLPSGFLPSHLIIRSNMNMSRTKFAIIFAALFTRPFVMNMQ